MVNENLLMYAKAKGFSNTIEPFSRANELMDVIMDFSAAKQLRTQNNSPNFGGIN